MDVQVRCKRWLQESTLAQRKWALEYLGKRGYWSAMPPSNDFRKAVKRELEKLPNTGEGAQFFTRMQTAWRVHKTENKKGAKQRCSFSLDHGAQRALDGLAKLRGERKSTVLEWLILEGAHLQASYKAALKEAEETVKSIRSEANEKVAMLEQQIQALQAELEQHKLDVNIDQEAGLKKGGSTAVTVEQYEASLKQGLDLKVDPNPTSRETK